MVEAVVAFFAVVGIMAVLGGITVAVNAVDELLFGD